MMCCLHGLGFFCPPQRLSRTYAHSVAGVTTLMLYNEITKRFTLTFYVTAACTSNTTEVKVY